jgi:glutamine synthetase
MVEPAASASEGPAIPEQARMSELGDWLETRKIDEVECVVPDINGILRGKIMPAAKLVDGERNGSLRLASSVFAVSVTGAYVARRGDDGPHIDPDMVLRPDPESICIDAGSNSARALVFADPFTADGAPWACAPRHVLKSVKALYAAKGLRVHVAPELEFYLTAPPTDPALPLTPPVGGDGKSLPPAPYGIEALGGYHEITEEIYRSAGVAGLKLETLIHESGPGQLEINFTHGDPIGRADQTLIFKRIVRRAAAVQGLAATFMAQPLEHEAPSAMHLHLSLTDEAGDRNLFADADGADSAELRHFIGGLQSFLPQVAPLFAPNVNSFRRMRPRYSAPVSVEWGHDNRTCGLRVPISDGANRRVEIRLAGADSNPYLAISAAMISGLLGIEGAMEPSPEVATSAYHKQRSLPQTMEDALDRFAACEPVRLILGEPFVQAFLAIKEGELDAFQAQVTPWERRHLASRV